MTIIGRVIIPAVGRRRACDGSKILALGLKVGSPPGQDDDPERITRESVVLEANSYELHVTHKNVRPLTFQLTI
jgi:hypothetical protein